MRTCMNFRMALYVGVRVRVDKRNAHLGYVPVCPSVVSHFLPFSLSYVLFQRRAAEGGGYVHGKGGTYWRPLFNAQVCACRVHRWMGR